MHSLGRKKKKKPQIPELYVACAIHINIAIYNIKGVSILPLTVNDPWDD